VLGYAIASPEADAVQISLGKRHHTFQPVRGQSTSIHLPTGIWYAPGVKANVLFSDKKPAAERPWTQSLWVYDFRTNIHFTLKQNPLR
jgi:hypothetical protein